MKARDLALVGELVSRVPELLPVLQAHLDDYDGLLPHLFMGDVTRWISGVSSTVTFTSMT